MRFTYLFFLEQDQSRQAERARRAHLARSGSQSEHRIRFILPTGVASDIIRNIIWLLVFSSLVPSLPPSNVIAQAVNLSSIFVRWDPIPAEGRNGIITGYKAWYRKMVEPAVWKRMEFCNVYWCEATNLEMNTPYRINVAGFTMKGAGPVASVEAITERGGKV